MTVKQWKEYLEGLPDDEHSFIEYFMNGGWVRIGETDIRAVTVLKQISYNLQIN